MRKDLSFIFVANDLIINLNQALFIFPMNNILIEEKLQDNGTTFVKIEYSSDQSWVYVEWIGYQTEERSKKGMNKYLDIMQKYKVTQVLNDNRKQTGPYPKGIDSWIAQDWFPRALKAGFKHAATILAEGIFTQLSSKQLETTVAGASYKVFQSEYDAKAWLKSVK